MYPSNVLSQGCSDYQDTKIQQLKACCSNHHSNKLGFWYYCIRRTVNDEDILEFSSLLIKLITLNLVDSKPDGRKWKLKSTGNFSCKSFHNYLISDNLDRVFVPAKFPWKAKAHPKVKVLGWVGGHRRVNTCDVLQKRRPHSYFSPHWCVLCKAQGEAFIMFLYIVK